MAYRRIGAGRCGQAAVGGATLAPVAERGLVSTPPWPSGSGEGLLIPSTQVRILPGAPPITHKWNDPFIYE